MMEPKVHGIFICYRELLRYQGTRPSIIITWKLHTTMVQANWSLPLPLRCKKTKIFCISLQRKAWNHATTEFATLKKYHWLWVSHVVWYFQNIIPLEIYLPMQNTADLQSLAISGAIVYSRCSDEGDDGIDRWNVGVLLSSSCCSSSQLCWPCLQTILQIP
jgi:hypothetical protein